MNPWVNALEYQTRKITQTCKPGVYCVHYCVDLAFQMQSNKTFLILCSTDTELQDFNSNIEQMN